MPSPSQTVQELKLNDGTRRYRAKCTYGNHAVYTGPVRNTLREAQTDLRDHDESKHGDTSLDRDTKRELRSMRNPKLAEARQKRIERLSAKVRNGERLTAAEHRFMLEEHGGWYEKNRKR